MIRVGLFLYDHLTRRSLLPGSQAVRLDRPPYDSGLRPRSEARLRLFRLPRRRRAPGGRQRLGRARSAARASWSASNASSARREQGVWRAQLSNGETLQARAVVNAAGPWVKQVLNEQLGQPTRDAVRLVKGSHIVLPQLYEGEHAFILQNDDRRVVFMIPFEEHFTLVGTTDVDYEGDAAAPAASDGRGRVPVPRRGPLPGAAAAARRGGLELCRRAPALRRRLRGSLRRLRATTPCAWTTHEGAAPSLSVFGGKITTYRRLAEHALDKLGALLSRPAARHGRRTRRYREAISAIARRQRRELFKRYPQLPPPLLQAVFRRHGTLGARSARRRSPWRGLRRRADRARGALLHRARMGAGPPKTCCGGERSAACT